jgi:hypothetical protein
MRVGPFLVATAIGMTPATFLMAAAGDLGSASWGTLVGLVVGVAALATLAAWFRPRRSARPNLRASAPEAEACRTSAAPEVLRQALAQEEAGPVHARLDGR